MAEGGISLSNAWILPFVIFLLCVAIIPLINHHFWDRHLWWFSLGFFCFPMVYALVFILGGPFIQKTVEKCMEYVSFMILLASLYVISGGILI
ncbi:MAG TPA: sodium:proton antiporter, partial [Leptospiraceae bacterium]|nr:sodium:proton antiporter [Leptospiraceae bacterium]